MHTVAFRVAAVLWVIWGLVHMLAGGIILSQDAAGAVAAVADAVDPATLAMAYPDAVGAILNQHGWNLGWIGLTTLVCAVPIWREGASWAVFLAALTGGMADVGYFLFLDLGGFVHFVPGTVMTIYSRSAIGLTFWAHFTRDEVD
jgi:hypothetical protein